MQTEFGSSASHYWLSLCSCPTPVTKRFSVLENSTLLIKPTRGMSQRGLSYGKSPSHCLNHTQALWAPLTTKSIQSRASPMIPRVLFQAWYHMHPMSFMLEGKWPFLGKAPQGLRVLIPSGLDVLFIDQLDIASGVLVTLEDKLRLLCYLPHGPIMQHSQLRASSAATVSWCPNSASTQEFSATFHTSTEQLWDLQRRQASLRKASPQHCPSVL